jgi:parallel beta-helix repeat protein
MLRNTVCFAVASLALASPAAARNLVVRPGQSIQAAVNAANPGDNVVVLPGTYHESGSPCPTNPANTCAVVVNKPRIALIGASAPHRRVVLENPGGQDQGIAIAPSPVSPATCLDDDSQRLRGASVSGFTVNGFDGEGIFFLCVDHFAALGNEVNDNAEYGIFPSHTTGGRVAFNLATGSNDTGIYIGQSRNVRVDHNLASGNVSGFEIENCSGVRADHNVAKDNTGGILSFTLPFLDVANNAGNRIDHNLVKNNNKPNTCGNPQDEVCGVPVGTGILALAVDRNRIDHNEVRGNDSYGIAVANFCVANHLSDADCKAIGIEPNPDDVQVRNNVARDNGANPSPLIDPVFGVDLAWDGTGVGNCWQDNKFGTQFPEPLPSCK